MFETLGERKYIIIADILRGSSEYNTTVRAAVEAEELLSRKNAEKRSRPSDGTRLRVRSTEGVKLGRKGNGNRSKRCESMEAEQGRGSRATR